MIDFGKKLGKSITAKPLNPSEIYESLDRSASAGPLRPVQTEVLSEWHSKRRESKDTIIKLHTGEGKTLIGLLILQSYLNEGKGPAMYVCPNKQLVTQVAKDATKFGIPYVLMTGADLPNEFTNSKQILIIHVQKVFNGKTIFGLNNQGFNVGAVILDDSHSCIESIKNAYSINIEKQHDTEAYKEILDLFRESLKNQGQGTFLDIQSNDYSESVMCVPYWDWIEKIDEVSKILHAHQDSKGICFSYPLLKDNLINCTAYVSASSIEIVPDFNLISKFSSFHRASHRILMSATTQDDSFFIKGLLLSKEAVLNPMTANANKWSGEKMILFPALIDESLNSVSLRRWLSSEKSGKGVSKVVLVPSYKLANEYEKEGSTVVKRDNLFSELNYLKTATIFDHTVVFVNRYDGIDLPDNQCRVLVIDSMPVYGSPSERYEQFCRENSNVIKTKIAQKIEQGLGRSVRSTKDYSVIIIIGSDITNFMNNANNWQHFTAQTIQQIKIGKNACEMVREDNATSKVQSFIDVINQCLRRDDGWKAYYVQEMADMPSQTRENAFIELFCKEMEAEKAIEHHEYQKAASIYNDIARSVDSEFDKGWYLQKVAKCEYHSSKVESKKTQKAAHSANGLLLINDIVSYKKIQLIDCNRNKVIQSVLKRQKTHESLNCWIELQLNCLSFGVAADKFEKALRNIGELLGFVSERPDQKYKKGPDNLWGSPQPETFFAFECKNEVKPDRDAINKEEVGQMNNHIGWFKAEYPEVQDVTFIHVHRTNVISNNANYSDNIVRIMTPVELDKLKDNIRGFIKEFAKYDLASIDINLIQSALVSHHLLPSDIIKLYTVNPIHR